MILVWSMVFEFYFSASHISPPLITTALKLKWIMSELNWVKFNMDGSSLANLGLAGGGIIQDYNGVWISGFSRAIGSATSVTAELWALRVGHKLCLNLNLFAVEVNLDAMLVVYWLSGPTNTTHSSLIMDCKEFLILIPQMKVDSVKLTT